MKIIKSLSLVAVCVSVANLLQAQEAKTQVLQRKEVKAPPADNALPKETPVAALQTPSPSKKDDNKKQVLTKDMNSPAGNLTAEQLKTLNGTAQKPKEPAPAAVVSDNNKAAGKPVIIPAQNQ